MSVTKIIKTETAHRLFGYHGACANIHGHSYKFEITFKRDEDELNDLGMEIDFKEIKKTVGLYIMAHFDHAIVLSTDDPLLPTLANSCVKITVMDKNPTAENMAEMIFTDCQNAVDAELTSVVVWETENAFARYPR